MYSKLTGSAKHFENVLVSPSPEEEEEEEDDDGDNEKVPFSTLITDMLS